MGRTRLMLLAPLLALLALLQSAPARAQEVSAQVTAGAPGPVTVGDPVQMVVEVVHPAGTFAILPALKGSWGDFEVRDVSAPVTEERDEGSLVTRQSLEVVLFAPGEFDTPPLLVNVSDRTGVTLQAVAPPLRVTVTSVLAEGETEPRDIKPQAILRAGWLTPQLAGGLLGLLVAGVGSYSLWRRVRHGGLLGRTALQRVLDELDGIAAANLPAQGRYKELYLAVTHSVRRHAEREFGVDLHERTTSEMRSMLRSLALHPELQRRLLTLFAESDLVKFAQVTPTPQSAEALLGEARAVAQDLTSAREAAHHAQQPQPGAAAAPVQR